MPNYTGKRSNANVDQQILLTWRFPGRFVRRNVMVTEFVGLHLSNCMLLQYTLSIQSINWSNIRWNYLIKHENIAIPLFAEIKNLKYQHRKVLAFCWYKSACVFSHWIQPRDRHNSHKKYIIANNANSRHFGH